MADAIARAEPSVVAIHRVKGRPARRRPWPSAAGGTAPRAETANALDLPERRRRRGEDFISFDYGSGVVIGDQGRDPDRLPRRPRGRPADGARPSGRQSFEAEVIAADPRSDLAVIAPVQQAGRGSARGSSRSPSATPPGCARARSWSRWATPSTRRADDGSPSASWGILSNVARRLEAESDDISVTGPSETSSRTSRPCSSSTPS